MKDRFFTGTRKGFFRFDRQPDGTWKEGANAFLGVQVPAILPDPRDGSLYAVAEHGHFGIKLHRSDDGGESWEELDSPAYPEKPEDAPVVVDAFRQVEVPWSLEKLWVLETGGADQPGVLWAGTIPGGLFRSEDRGESWELNRPLWDHPDRAKWAGGGYDFAGIHSICVDPRDSDRISLGISCGGVWNTEDGGKSWEQGAHGMRFDFLPPEQGGDSPDGQDPHRMVRCSGAPNDFWVQHHCAIYRSTDDARSWREIFGVEPSGFGFAVAVHPGDSDTAWFVPAKKDEYRYPVDGRFVVNRTRDGGKTFETLSAGLPEPPAYDLVYRHALEVDPGGEGIVMGSTTGGLWVSEDQGDSWQAVSVHLPPVYCVRI